MRNECDNCEAECEELFRVGGYLACEACYIQSQLPWWQRVARGR